MTSLQKAPCRYNMEIYHDNMKYCHIAQLCFYYDAKTNINTLGLPFVSHMELNLLSITVFLLFFLVVEPDLLLKHYLASLKH